jgi:hypothetical protein
MKSMVQEWRSSEDDISDKYPGVDLRVDPSARLSSFHFQEWVTGLLRNNRWSVVDLGLIEWVRGGLKVGNKMVSVVVGGKRTLRIPISSAKATKRVRE